MHFAMKQQIYNIYVYIFIVSHILMKKPLSKTLTVTNFSDSDDDDNGTNNRPRPQNLRMKIKAKTMRLFTIQETKVKGNQKTSFKFA